MFENLNFQKKHLYFLQLGAKFRQKIWLKIDEIWPNSSLNKISLKSPKKYFKISLKIRKFRVLMYPGYAIFPTLL
mgnify:CR=1 FL=1